MAGVALFGIGVIVDGQGKGAGQGLEVHRDAGELVVRISRTILVVISEAAERAQMRQVAQDGIDGLIFVEDENDVLDLFGRPVAQGHDAGVRCSCLAKLLSSTASLQRSTVLRSTFWAVPKM